MRFSRIDDRLSVYQNVQIVIFGASVSGKDINEARNKYYHRYYIEAQEQLEFSKEYFDWSFNGKVLNHFYSKEDIEKFREKWESHIK